MTETTAATQESAIVGNTCLRCQGPLHLARRLMALEWGSVCAACEQAIRQDAAEIALHSALTVDEAASQELAQLINKTPQVAVLRVGHQTLITLANCVMCGRRGVCFDGECLECSFEAIGRDAALKNEDMERLREIKHQERTKSDLRHQRAYLLQHIEALQARLYRVNQALEESA